MFPSWRRGGLEPELDRVSAMSCLAYEWSIGGYSLQRGIDKIRSDQFIDWSSQGTEIRPAPLVVPENRITSPQDPALAATIDHMLDLMRQALQQRARSADGVCIDLTAGLDSRAILAVAIDALGTDQLFTRTHCSLTTLDGKVAEKITHKVGLGSLALLEADTDLGAKVSWHTDAIGFGLNGDFCNKSVWLPSDPIDDFRRPSVSGAGGEIYRGFYFPALPGGDWRTVSPAEAISIPHFDHSAKMPWASIEGKGRWAHSSGDRAKFGLTITEILQCIKLLEANDLKDSLRLLHLHMGSQISDIGVLKAGIDEAARVYAQLVKLGVPLEYFDVGGGLGVDYDGSQSDSHSSKNYSLAEYVTDIVSGLKRICHSEGVPHPNIVTESGRAITAHHSCIVTNVLGEINPLDQSYPTQSEVGEDSLTTSMRALLEDISDDSLQCLYDRANQLKKESLQSFTLGKLSIEDRARIETLYWRVLASIDSQLKGNDVAPEGLKEISSQLASQYLCNFSVFQSAPDTWAIDQVLPVMPITRLNEEPTQACTLADITCDSDGKMDHFVGRSGAKRSILLHTLQEASDYFVGIFLTGAYQDVIGDMHNLFGRLNEVHIFSDSADPDGFYIEEVIKGNSASNVLSTMQYHPDHMIRTIKTLVDERITQGKIAPKSGIALVDFYQECLLKSTYPGSSEEISG
ncbi:MAG: biosynthetic arginine decarboxylase [Gammaproteobacteria bacterium]|nr:biosynthetic arginine decarboxylase [Gammaproteobacteria bacterium]